MQHQTVTKTVVRGQTVFDQKDNMNGDVLPPDRLAHILCVEKNKCLFLFIDCYCGDRFFAEVIPDEPNFEVEGEKENQ